MKGISILGSTGSIGVNTLNVIRLHPDRFRVVSLAAGSNLSLLTEQVEEFKPEYVSLTSVDDVSKLKGLLPTGVGHGVEGASIAASMDGVDLTVSAISGAAGLMPTLAAVKAGKEIALANKETLVMAGEVVMAEAARQGVRILPVDSEHSAVFQSITGHRPEDIKRIILTASGGPFRERPVEEFDTITPSEALNHPNWDMGKKITIDSATLLNKGLEVIEARWLFGLTPEKISVSVHPQSIVHSMVEYIDGSMMAQMGSPDMRGPIAYALAYPERVESGAPTLDLTRASLEFFEPDTVKFPCLALSYDALKEGGTMPAVLNAADEVAVDAFLGGRIPFTGIPALIEGVMDAHDNHRQPSLEDVLAADAWARRAASEAVGG